MQSVRGEILEKTVGGYTVGINDGVGGEFGGDLIQSFICIYLFLELGNTLGEQWDYVEGMGIGRGGERKENENEK